MPTFRFLTRLLLLIPMVASLAMGVARAASVPEQLFNDVAGATDLTDADKTRIAALLPLAVGEVGLIDNEEGCHERSHVAVVFRDLNGDGRQEVLVSEGNGCLYGMRGTVTHFLAVDGQGRWREILRGDGNAHQIKVGAPGAWPTILPGVMGFCYPVFDYSDAQQKYVLVRRVADPKVPDACKHFDR